MEISGVVLMPLHTYTTCAIPELFKHSKNWATIASSNSTTDLLGKVIGVRCECAV